MATSRGHDNGSVPFDALGTPQAAHVDDDSLLELTAVQTLLQLKWYHPHHVLCVAKRMLQTGQGRHPSSSACLTDKVDDKAASGYTLDAESLLLEMLASYGEYPGSVAEASESATPGCSSLSAWPHLQAAAKESWKDVAGDGMVSSQSDIREMARDDDRHPSDVCVPSPLAASFVSSPFLPYQAGAQHSAASPDLPRSHAAEDSIHCFGAISQKAEKVSSVHLQEPTVSASSQDPTAGLASLQDPPLSVSPQDPPLSVSPQDPPLSVSPQDPPLSVSPQDPSLSVSPQDPPLSVSPQDSPLSVSPQDPPLSVSPQVPPLSVSPQEPPVSMSPQNSPVSMSPQDPPVSMSPQDPPLSASPQDPPSLSASALDPNSNPHHSDPTMPTFQSEHSRETSDKSSPQHSDPSIPVCPTEDSDKPSSSSQLAHVSDSWRAARARLEELRALNRRLKARRTCRECGMQQANLTLLPCGHLCVCTECGPALTRCPVCRVTILADVRTFLS